MKHITFTILGLLLMLQMGGCQDHDFKVPITVISIQYPDGTIQTTAQGTGIVDWASVTNKPLTFPPSVHSHDALYKPIGYVPTWAEITSKPPEIDLAAAILTLGYLPIPSKTTAEINALVVPSGMAGLVYDRTLGVYKVRKGLVWAIVITDR